MIRLQKWPPLTDATIAGFSPWDRERAKLCKMTLDELKAAWDAWDGGEDPLPGISGEGVHYELNRRGEGIYCAI